MSCRFSEYITFQFVRAILGLPSQFMDRGADNPLVQG